MAFEKELQTNQDNSSERLSKAHYRESNPFRGLEFFDSEHAPFFYGRTKIIGEVLDVLRQQVADKKPFVLVLGPEGSGKTSLVRAGILPVLTQGRVAEGDHSWRLAFTRPGNGGTGDPFDALAAALLEKSALPEFPDAATRNGWQNLAAELREAPDNTALRLRETLQYLSMQALDHFLDKQEFEAPPGHPEQSVELPGQNKPERLDSKVQLALVVDQLEDLFVRGFSPELQQSFITALGALVRWRVAVVIAVLRSDFYASFQKCCGPQDLGIQNQSELSVRNIDLSEVLQGRFDLYPPNRQEIGEMIRLPAEAIGLRFELDPETGRNLDAALLEAATACPYPLPLLEHLLWQLYRKQSPRKDGLLRWSDYRESGGLEGALANHAESVLLALDNDAQAALKPILRQLGSPGPGEDSAVVRRTVSYRDLNSTPEFSEHGKAGAEKLIDRFIKEGLFHTERGPNAEVLVTVTQEYVVRNWPRARQLLNEDLGLLRTRDRLEPNFRLWLSRGGRSYSLLRSSSGIRDAEALLRGFRTSLSDTQVNYLQRSLKAKSGRRWFRVAAVLAIVAGLVAPFVIPGVRWLQANIEQRKAAQSSGPEGRVAHPLETQPQSVAVEQSRQGQSTPLPQRNAAIATSQRDALQDRLTDTEAKVQQIQKSLDLATSQRDALQNQLNETEAKGQQTQKNVELVTGQPDALQSQLKELTQKNGEFPADQRDALQTQLNAAEARAQQIQKSLELATGQRDALQIHLTEMETRAQQAQKDATLAASQRDALQTQLKDTEARAQQAQKDATLAASQRDAVQNQLKETEARAQQAQKDSALAASQRDGLQNQLKDTEAKAQQAQKDVELVASQRDALQSQLKELVQKSVEFPADQRNALQTKLNDAEAGAQQIQKNLELATGQRDSLRKQLDDTAAKAQQVQKDAALSTSQRDGLQNQLKETEAKAQQAQKDAVLATSQREAQQSKLKDTEARAQQVQKDAALAATQRDALQAQLQDTEAKAQQALKDAAAAAAQLKDAQARAQQAEKNADLATSQRDGLQAQLKDTEAKAQAAQKNGELAASQRDALQAQLKDTQAKAQQVQKNGELVAAQPQAEEGGPSNGKPAQEKSVFSANRTESHQNQPPPNSGLKAGPLALTQPLDSSIQPAQTTAMSSPTRVRRPAAAEVWTEESRGSAEAPAGDQEPMKLARKDQDNVALPQITPTPAAPVKPPLAETQAHKSADDAVDEAAVKQFVLEYIRTVTNEDFSTQERFFAQRVNFYGEGVLPLQKVRAVNERYNREWPNRNWQPQGEPEILRSVNSKQYEVLQPFTWKVSNGSQHEEGSGTLYFRISKNTKGEFQIVQVEHHER